MGLPAELGALLVRHREEQDRERADAGQLWRANAAPRSPRSTWPASSPRRTPTCPRPTGPSPRQVPRSLGPQRGPPAPGFIERCATGAKPLPSHLVLPRGGDRQMSAAPFHSARPPPRQRRTHPCCPALSSCRRFLARPGRRPRRCAAAGAPPGPAHHRQRRAHPPSSHPGNSEFASCPRPPAS